MFLRWVGRNYVPEAVFIGDGRKIALGGRGVLRESITDALAAELLATGDYEQVSAQDPMDVLAAAPVAIRGVVRSIDEHVAEILQDAALAIAVVKQWFLSRIPEEHRPPGLTDGDVVVGLDDLLRSVMSSAADRKAAKIDGASSSEPSLSGLRDGEDALFLAPADDADLVGLRDDGAPGVPPTVDDDPIVVPDDGGRLSQDGLIALGHELLVTHSHRAKLVELAKERGIRVDKTDGREAIVGKILGLPAGWATL